MISVYYFARLRRRPESVYCSDGEFHDALECGLGGHAIQLFRSFAEAEAIGDVSVVRCAGLSVEVVS